MNTSQLSRKEGFTERLWELILTKERLRHQVSMGTGMRLLWGSREPLWDATGFNAF